MARLLAVSSQLAAGSASDLRRSFGELSLVEDVGREKETMEMAYESTPRKYLLGRFPFGTDRGHFASVSGARRRIPREEASTWISKSPGTAIHACAPGSQWRRLCDPT